MHPAEHTALQGTTQYTTVATHSGAGSEVNIEGVEEIDVDLTIALLTGGTTKNFDAWLQGTINGTVWYDLSHDGARLDAEATAADSAQAAAGRRNITGTASVTAAGKHKAKYKNLCARGVRLKWIADLAGTTPACTFYAFLTKKQTR